MNGQRSAVELCEQRFFAKVMRTMRVAVSMCAVCCKHELIFRVGAHTESCPGTREHDLTFLSRRRHPVQTSPSLSPHCSAPSHDLAPSYPAHEHTHTFTHLNERRQAEAPPLLSSCILSVSHMVTTVCVSFKQALREHAKPRKSPGVCLQGLYAGSHRPSCQKQAQWSSS